MRVKPRLAAEAAFDGFYLLAGGVLGLLLLFGSGPERKLFGAAALVLILGDSFHLVPRIGAALTEDRERFAQRLGEGKKVTSITMTVFYLLLWQLALLRYPGAGGGPWTVLVWLTALLRIALCLCPQNRWTQGDGSPRWSLWRNLPFLLLGGMTALIYGRNALPGQALFWMAPAIVLSFAFYLPVVLGSARRPMLGMLMLPKSCVYLWILCMGLRL